MLKPAPKAGVMGWPVGHSLSPRLHGFWLQRYDIKGSYDAFPVRPEDLSSALRRLKDDGLIGVNLTIPHKVAARDIVDTLDPAASAIGAVNLVTVDARGVLRGDNTDAYGFAQNLLASGVAPNDGTAFVLGAGGAARAVLFALEDLGFRKILLSNRTEKRAQILAEDFSSPHVKISVVAWEDAPRALEQASLLVNATSLGMAGQPALDLSLDSLSPSASVADVVYAPLETSLLKRAKQRGCRTVDGLGMLLHQARPSFKAFFGLNPDVTDELRAFVLTGKKSS